jgi:peptide/nickel transport system substrate-binding protein
MKRRHSFAALAIGLSLVAAACGSDDDKTSNTTASTAAPTTTAAAGGDTTVASSTADTTDATTADSTEDTAADTTDATTADTTDETTDDTATEGASGGTVVIGVEQEWPMMDWMSVNAGSTYGSWAAEYFTTTRPFDIVQGDDGVWGYEPSNLLTGEPTLTTDGGVQVVTYEINPDAVWNDGEPITSTDFKYTWNEVVTGEDILDTTTFIDVESVDDSDPSKAVFTFKTPNASWEDMFEAYGIYPSHLLEGKDRNAETADGYTWSAGPYQLVEWEKGVGATFEKNPKWWGEPSKIDTIEEKFFADTAAEFQAFKAGEVDTIGPQPQLDAIDAINAGGLPGSSAVDPNTGNVEALWLNNAAFPFDDVAVRQAFAYSIDRDAIVNRLFGGIGVSAAVNSLNPPILAEYSDQESFADYKLDLDKVTELMTGAGWAKGDDGVWAKDGKKASFVFKTTAGNKRRELTEQVLQSQLADAGFDMQIENQQAADLFGTQLPAGDFTAALYAQTATTLNPGLCSIMCSFNIPDDGASGQNYTRTNIEGLDDLLQTVNTETDTDLRAKAAKDADALLAENVASLPLDPLPNIGFYGDRIQGDFSTNVILGPWWNISTWTVTDRFGRPEHTRSGPAVFARPGHE